MKEKTVQLSMYRQYSQHVLPVWIENSRQGTLVNFLQVTKQLRRFNVETGMTIVSSRHIAFMKRSALDLEAFEPANNIFQFERSQTKKILATEFYLFLSTTMFLKIHTFVVLFNVVAIKYSSKCNLYIWSETFRQANFYYSGDKALVDT